MRRHLWTRRLLTICPVLVALLWIAGVSRIHDFALETIEWMALIALAFTLHVLHRRFRRPRPLPALPPQTNPAILAAIVAAIGGVLALLGGGLCEWLLEGNEPPALSLPLRALWHGACAFGGGYCSVLPRLQDAVGQQRRNDAGGGSDAKR